MTKQFPKYKKIFKDISDELLILFEELNVERSKINKNVPPLIKRKVQNKIYYWKKKGLLDGYFGFLVKSLKRYTYSNCLRLLIYGIYAEKEQELFETSKEVFLIVSNDLYNQALSELPRMPKMHKKPNWQLINNWLIVLSVNMTFIQYLSALTQVAYEESYKLLLNRIQQEQKLREKDLKKPLDKQLHRVLNVHDNKYSGVVETLSRTVGNKSYIEPFPNQKVRFIAEIDDRTTKMCLSLNNQEFNTKDKNIFHRYSADYGYNIKYEIDGLVAGINLPPIMDHFHYCRSTLTYQID